MSLATNLTFTLLTHNLYCHYIVHSPDMSHRMEFFVRNMAKHDHDVVLVQELFLFNFFGILLGDQLRNWVSAEFSKLGYAHQVLGAVPPRIFGQNSGLLIFSKHPILAFEEKRWYRYDDFGTGKGFQRALIKIHDRDINFFNVHLDAHHGWVRKKQLESLIRDFPKPISSSYIVIGGDYNIDTNNTNGYNDMMELMTPYEIYDIFQRESVQTHHDGQSLDHILVSNNIMPVNKNVLNFLDNKGEGISDHFGLSAELSLPDLPPPPQPFILW